MAAQAAVSRILFAMARDGKLPAMLAKVHPRYKTPYMKHPRGGVAVAAAGLLFSARLDDLSRVVNFGALTRFCAAAPVRRESLTSCAAAAAIGCGM